MDWAQFIKDFGFPITLSMALLIGIGAGLRVLWTYMTGEVKVAREGLEEQRKKSEEVRTAQLEVLRNLNDSQKLVADNLAGVQRALTENHKDHKDWHKETMKALGGKGKGRARNR